MPQTGESTDKRNVITRWQKHLQQWYPERVPAFPETIERMPLELQKFYRRRRISELAARCMIADHARIKFLQSKCGQHRAVSA